MGYSISQVRKDYKTHSHVAHVMVKGGYMTKKELTHYCLVHEKIYEGFSKCPECNPGIRGGVILDRKED